MPTLEQLLPALLEGAALEPDYSVTHVECADDGADDDDFEVSFHPEPNGKGLVRSSVNVTQTTAKIVALRALGAYVDALGTHLLPGVDRIVRSVLPVVNFRFHPLVRAAAARTLTACYEQIARAAASADTPAVGIEAASNALHALAKPLAEALFVEEEPEAAEVRHASSNPMCPMRVAL